jgi:non-heme chloroperoxidase
LVNNEAVIDAGKEMVALEDPIRPELVREFHLSAIHHPVPEGFLSTALLETLKVPARVWRDYYEGTTRGCCSRSMTRPDSVRSARRR